MKHISRYHHSILMTLLFILIGFSFSASAQFGGFGGASNPPPSTPLAPNISGSSSIPINTQYTVSVRTVANADFYVIHESRNGSAYSVLRAGVTSMAVTKSTAGTYSYKIEACSTVGCSSLGAARSVEVFGRPGTPGNVRSSSSSVEQGNTLNISWNSASSVISGGFYQLQELRPNGSGQVLATVSHTSASSYTRSVRPVSGGGVYRYQVRACNSSSLCSSWGTRSVTVTLPNVSPSLSNITPSSNSEILINERLTISASANDSDGSISRVEFRINNGSWVNDTSSPYSRNYDNLAVGSHTLNIRARDNDGAYSSTATRVITVTDPNSKRRIVFIHTDALGSPAAETDENGDKQ